MNNVTPIRTQTSLPTAAAIETALIKGDLSVLSDAERLDYYKTVCESVGLNPMTQPFEYITLNGKLRLYARKDCTDQLRTLHKVSVIELTEADWDGVFIVTAKVQNDEGRTDAAKGAVHLGNLKGEALANAIMKAETKAKRRATLSICGLGFLDEVEVEDIPAETKAPRILKKDTKALYTALQSEMDAAATSADNLLAWGKASAERVKQLPADWQLSLSSAFQDVLADIKAGNVPLPCAEIIANRWADKQGESLTNAARAHQAPESQPDADGVVWEETHVRPATAEDKPVEAPALDPAIARAILVDKIKSTLIRYVQPTEQRKKEELLATHFKATWTEIVHTVPIERLQDGLDTMTFTLTGDHSEFHQERLARVIAAKPKLDQTERPSGIPTFLERRPPSGQPRRIPIAAE